MKKRVIDVLKEEDNLGIIWHKLRKAKVPRPLIPIMILFVELENLKDFFENKYKLITIFGVFGALTVYLVQFSPRASYFSLMTFFLIGVLLLYELYMSKKILTVFFGIVIFYGLLNEVYIFILSRYYDYLEQIIKTVQSYFAIIVSVVILLYIWYKIKPKIINIKKNFFEFNLFSTKWE